MLATVQLPWMLIANQNWFQKHARSFIYAIRLNETGYIGLFFLTEKIYEKIYLRKGLLIWGNLKFKSFFVWQKKKTKRSPKLRFIAQNKCMEIILPVFISSSLSHNWIISAGSKALKPNKSVHQYDTMQLVYFCAWFGSICLHVCCKIKFEGKSPFEWMTALTLYLSVIFTLLISLSSLPFFSNNLIDIFSLIFRSCF